MNLNKVIIVGRLTAAPELRRTPSGASVTTFSIATNRTWTDKGGAKQDETEFHTIVAWGRQAEIASQFLTKGALAMIEGRLRTRGWQDKQGLTHKTTEIICERMQLGPKPGQGGAAAPGGFSAPGRSGESQAAAKGQDSAPEEIPIIDLEDGGGEEIPF